MSIIFSVFGLILQLIGIILFQYYGWVVIVVILVYMIWQNRRRTKWISQTDQILLRIEVPKDNEKKELSAEQMFASLHGILRPRAELVREGALQEHVSLEIASVENKIQFYVWTPRHLKDFVEGQIYAQYPSVQIREGADDYARHEIGDRAIYGTELTLTNTEVLPIKTFTNFDVDPLAGITAVLAKLDETGEEMWVQILARPVDDAWQNKGLHYIDGIKGGKTSGLGSDIRNEIIGLPYHIAANLFKGLASPPPDNRLAEQKKGGGKVEMSTGQQALAKAVEEKITKLGFAIKIRIAYLGPDQTLGQQRIQAIVGAFKQFNTTNLNGFTTDGITDSRDFIDEYRARLFLDGGYILNIEELASLYHLPHKSVETPNMVWTTTKTVEPPSTLPSEHETKSDEVSYFGLTNFRAGDVKFGIKRADRGRHLYIVGQTGTGKSMLLQLLTLSDVYHDVGFAVVDPHGDYAMDIMKYIPEHRLKDVVYFNPADLDFPIAFNPLEVTDPNFKNHISSELVGVLKRMFDSWGPRLEYILRFTILALLDYPDATMLGITRMLTEKEFRKKVIHEIKDPVVRNFWVNEFASWNDKFASEAVAPVLNKVGAFTANPLVRNVIGQPKGTLDLRKVMDEGKILIVNLSRGLVGEDNAGILGALLVTKIQLAAMSRANVPKEERRPFYLYVDEFQNFATDSFAVILSEARKYGLNLTVANQYVAQMPETVRDAVFGNVGSMISFRISATDATYVGKYFAPAFEPDDLIKLHNQHIVISMSIDGEKTAPFSATTLKMPDPEHDYTEQIIELSRQAYASKREDVERAINEWSNDGGTTPPPSTGMPVPTNREQKPNSFLGELKNPDRPQTSSYQGNRPNQSQNQNRNANRNNQNWRNNQQPRRPQQQHQPQRTQQTDYQQHDDRQPQDRGEATTAQPVEPTQPQNHEISQGQEIHLR